MDDLILDGVVLKRLMPNLLCRVFQDSLTWLPKQSDEFFELMVANILAGEYISVNQDSGWPYCFGLGVFL